MSDTVYSATIFAQDRVFTAISDTAQEAAVLAWRDSLRDVCVDDVDQFSSARLRFGLNQAGTPKTRTTTDHVDGLVLVFNEDDWPLGFVMPLHRESDR